jgi:hypothetical protein
MLTRYHGQIHQTKQAYLLQLWYHAQSPGGNPYDGIIRARLGPSAQFSTKKISNQLLNLVVEVI